MANLAYSDILTVNVGGPFSYLAVNNLALTSNHVCVDDCVFDSGGCPGLNWTTGNEYVEIEAQRNTPNGPYPGTFTDSVVLHFGIPINN